MQEAFLRHLHTNLKIKLLVLFVALAALILSGCENLPILQQSTVPATSETPVSNPSETISPTPGANTPASPAPSVTSTFSPFPTPTSTPTFTPYQPTGEQSALFQYMLDLINKDRQGSALAPVVLSYNAAAQKHAQDMFDNFYLSHWGTDGLKPYMRFTQQGGENYEQENSAYSGWFNVAENPDSYAAIDVKEELKTLQWAMMNDDAASNWGHRNNILNKLHKKVNLGIAFDNHRVTLVQQFEGDYIEFTLPPTLNGNVLSLSGKFSLGILNNVSIYYDEFPQSKTASQLNNGPHSYSLGTMVGYLIEPAKPGEYYTNLPPEAIEAGRWEVDQNGHFAIQSNIGQYLVHGKGVYTITLITIVDNKPQPLSNYSIFVE